MFHPQPPKMVVVFMKLHKIKLWYLPSTSLHTPCDVSKTPYLMKRVAMLVAPNTVAYLEIRSANSTQTTVNLFEVMLIALFWFSLSFDVQLSCRTLDRFCESHSLLILPWTVLHCFVYIHLNVNNECQVTYRMLICHYCLELSDSFTENQRKKLDSFVIIENGLVYFPGSVKLIEIKLSGNCGNSESIVQKLSFWEVSLRKSRKFWSFCCTTVRKKCDKHVEFQE